MEVFMYEKYFEKLTEECEIRNRSANTARTYSDNIKRFLIDVGKHPDQLLLDDARQYILKKRREGISAEYCNNINSSLAFFYKHVLHLFWDQEIVPRMKRDYTLPEVLSVEEVERMINTATEVRNNEFILICSVIVLPLILYLSSHCKQDADGHSEPIGSSEEETRQTS